MKTTYILAFILGLTFVSCNTRNKDAEVEKAKAEAAMAKAEQARAEAELAKVQAEQATAKAEEAANKAAKAQQQPAHSSSVRRAAVISDPDGYTNVRQQPNTNSAIVTAVYDGEVFYFERISGSKWVSVYKTPSSPRIGYMHSSRVRPL